MNNIPHISPSFIEIARQFKVVLLDSYGVLKNYQGVVSGAEQAIKQLRQRDTILRVLTNDASRSPRELVMRMEEQGLHGILPHEVVSSGMMARDFISRKGIQGQIAYLGTPASAAYILGTGREAIAVEDIQPKDVVTIGAVLFLDDEGYDWATSLNRTVNLLRQRTIPVVVANTDKLYPLSSGDVSIATGGLAKLIENITGKKFLYFGKPDTQMFNYTLEDVRREIDFTFEDVLMVGDTLQTDILGGNKMGIKTMLVLSGNTRRDERAEQIHSSGIMPDYICDSIGS